MSKFFQEPHKSKHIQKLKPTRHITVKLLKTSTKENIVKAAREKDTLNTKKKNIGMHTEFSPETYRTEDPGTASLMC